MPAIWAEVRCPLVRQGGFGAVCGSSFPTPNRFQLPQSQYRSLSTHPSFAKATVGNRVDLPTGQAGATGAL